MRAIVIGAGVGGLTAALALRRSGWDVTVLERGDALRPRGAGISIAPNAMHAFDAIEIGARVREAGEPAPLLGARRPDGSWIFRQQEDSFTGRYGYPLYILLRSDLLAVLAEALARDSEPVRFASEARVVRCGDGGQLAAVQLTDGTVLEAELVVAADGGQSAVRADVFPGHPGPSYGGFRVWWMLAPSLAGAGNVVGSETLGRGLTFGIMPLRDGRVYAYASMLTPEQDPAADPEPLAGLRTVLSDWHPDVRAILADADPARVFSDNARWMARPLPAFHRGRVAMLGDAAHPMTPDLGQGGCQAIEDAVVLARSLAGSTEMLAGSTEMLAGSTGMPARSAGTGAEFPERLQAYTDARLPRATKIAARSHSMSRLHHASKPLGMLARDRALWLGGRLPPNITMRSVDFIYTWRP
jgi:2-polyprenyl-6-methoxyphenol hydroxylase-like FAD-dependent oxidoreductase